MLTDNYPLVLGAVFGLVFLYMIFDFSDYIPHFLLLVYLFLAIFYKLTKLEKAIPLTTIFLISFGPIVLLRSRKISITNYWPVACYLLIVIGTSNINDVSMLKNVSAFMHVTIALICAISLTSRNVEKRVVLFTHLYIGWVALNAIFSILQVFIGEKYYLMSMTQGYEIGRIQRGYGLVGMATIIGLQFCLGFPLITSLYVGEKGRRILWKLILLFLGVAGLILTFSRGAILGVLISIAFLLWLHRKYNVLAYYVFFCCIIVILYFSPTELFPKSYGIFFQGKDSSAAGRFPLLLISLRMFAERPITGFGYGGFSEYCTLYGSNIHREAHNTYAQVLVEFGIFGFIFFLLVIYMSLKGYWAYIKKGSSQTLKMHSIGYLCASIAILVNGFFHCFEWNLIFWLPIMFGFMMQYIAADEHKKALETQQKNN